MAASLAARSVATGRVLVCGAAALARRDELAEHPEDVGRLPVDFSRQRMEIAQALVRAWRDGRFTRRGLGARATEQSVSLSGQAHRAQASDVHVPGRALEGAVSGRFRGAVV